MSSSAFPVRSGPMEYFESEDSSSSISTAPVAASKPIAALKSDDVIFLDLKPSLAFAKFAGSVYSSAPPSIEKVGSAKFSRLTDSSSASAFESPIDKFNRLKHEITEFSSELEDFQRQASAAALDGGVSELAAALNAELKDLNSKIDRLSHEPRIKSLIGADGEILEFFSSATVKESKVAESSNSSAPSLSNILAAFDRRLAALERSVGIPVGSAVAVAPRPAGAQKSAESANAAIWSRLTASFPDLHSGLMSVHRKLTLLEPQKLESINRILKSIIADYEVLEQRGAVNDGPQNPAAQQKISELYELLGRWDTFANQLPLIIARLQSLRVIHEQAALAVERQQEIQKNQEEIQKLLLKDQQMLEKLGNEFKSNQQQIEANMKAINDKMEKLQTEILGLK